MCRPQDSSKWLNDAKKLSQILETEAKWDWKHKSEIDTSQFEWYKKDKIWSDFEHLLPNIRHMIFAGGEPLLIKEHHSLIKKLVESGYSKNIELRYHTNGTIMEQDFIDLWKEFKQVELMISIDAWGEQNDYVRYPAKWDTILNNLSILDETPDNINIMMLASIHAMNIFDIPLLAKNSLDRGFKKINKKFHKGLFHPGTVHWPNYMCTKIFPKEIKEKIVERWNDFDQYLIDNPQWSQKIKKQLDFMLSEDWSNLFPSFLEYINKLDKIRGTSYSKTFPEFSKILKEYGDIDG
jgi:organic radical activating enzyme